MRLVNKAGLQFIAEQLRQHHKKGEELYDYAECISEWASDVENSTAEGNDPHFEILAWDSVSGHTECISLDPDLHMYEIAD
jgi:hypothetical protein